MVFSLRFTLVIVVIVFVVLAGIHRHLFSGLHFFLSRDYRVIGLLCCFSTDTGFIFFRLLVQFRCVARHTSEHDAVMIAGA